ncbi:MAG TPA: hypothetical protein VMZ22_04275 [Acidimicrobiales bacterium]|nr:hypothetical protein [Acidimicrobiales bacterium]
MKRNKATAAVSLVAAASLGAGACGSGSSEGDTTTTTREATTTTSTEPPTTVTEIATTVASVATTARTTRTTRRVSSTTSTMGYPYCPPAYSAQQATTSTSPTTEPPSSSTTVTAIVVCGRPYRRRWWRRSLMLPDVTDLGAVDTVMPDSVAAMSHAERAAAGARWLDDARSEAASVPAFAELALHLAVVGAPHDLVRQAHEAAADEIRHAEACLGLASVFLGRRFALGAMPQIAGRRVAGRFWWTRRRHLAKLAVDSLLDGCVSEGNSADHLRRRAAKATPEARAVANRLAEDEDRHTELAWDIVAWCKAEGGVTVARGLAKAMHAVGDRNFPREVAQRYEDLNQRVPFLIPTAH